MHRINSFALIFSTLLLLIVSDLASAVPQFAVGSYTLISTVPAGGRNYDFKYRATVTNQTASPIAGLNLTLSAASRLYFRVIDGTINTGPIPANGRVSSIDTFTLRRATRLPYALSTLNSRLVWQLAVASTPTPSPTPTPAPTPAQVTLDVSASDPNNQLLKYEWRVTAGSVANVNAPTTTWTLPPGPGVQFAYVQISNAHGGYAERRLAVITDALGVPSPSRSPVNLSPPAQSNPASHTYRKFIAASQGTGRSVYLPDVAMRYQDASVRTPVTGIADLRGEINMPSYSGSNDLPAAAIVDCSLTATATFIDCLTNWLRFDNNPAPSFVVTYSASHGSEGYAPLFAYLPPAPTTTVGQFIKGSLTLQDGSLCGTVNEFFETETAATATLLMPAALRSPDRSASTASATMLSLTMLLPPTLSCNANRLPRCGYRLL